MRTQFWETQERDRELETSMREKHRPAASCTPPTRDVPTTNVHALDRNRTWDLSVHRPTLYPLSQTGFGCMLAFYYIGYALSGQIIMRSEIIIIWPLSVYYIDIM